ncbi:MAG: DnaJ domain-containing protein [Candidatus Rokuibacteriota bacterium]
MARPRSDRDYYAVLGVEPSAPEDEIRRVYRRQALRWHPDRNAGDPAAAERFKEISEAYAVLIDPAKRHAWDAARRAGAPDGFRPTRDDLFRDLFADPRASAIFDELAAELQRMGLRVNRRDFRETLFGGRAIVTGRIVIVGPFGPATALLRVARAVARGALRARTDAAVATGRPAGWLGRLVAAAGRRILGAPDESRLPGETDIEVPLSLSEEEAARGVRKRVTLPGGGGDEGDVLVTVPPGVRTGTRLRLRGKGRPVPGGAAGDAYLVVEVTAGR